MLQNQLTEEELLSFDEVKKRERRRRRRRLAGKSPRAQQPSGPASLRGSRRGSERQRVRRSDESSSKRGPSLQIEWIAAQGGQGGQGGQARRRDEQRDSAAESDEP